jgi:hypothetical protein
MNAFLVMNTIIERKAFLRKCIPAEAGKGIQVYLFLRGFLINPDGFSGMPLRL